MPYSNSIGFPHPTHPAMTRAAARRTASAVRCVVEAMEGRRLLAGGDLDPTFAGGGLRHFDPSLVNNGVARAAAVQTDGKIVSAGGGQTEAGQEQGFILTRYLPDGNIDTAFGDDGVVITRVAGAPSRAEDVLIQSDGKIVAAGFATVGG